MTSVITDIPLECLPGAIRRDTEKGFELRIGVLIFHQGWVLNSFRWGADTMDDHLNDMLHTDVKKWHFYSLDDKSVHSVSFNTMLVYEYLKMGNHIILYTQWGCEFYDPELPVAHIDLSSRDFGRALLKKEYSYGDTLYHYYDREKTAAKHDTTLLMEASRGRFIDDFLKLGIIPDHTITVKELMSIAGNLVAAVMVCDWNTAMKTKEQTYQKYRFVEHDPLPGEYVVPLETIIGHERIDDVRERYEWYHPCPLSIDRSIYEDKIVKGYWPCDTINSYDYEALGIYVEDFRMDDDELGLIVFIDVPQSDILIEKKIA